MFLQSQKSVNEEGLAKYFLTATQSFLKNIVPLCIYKYLFQIKRLNKEILLLGETNTKYKEKVEESKLSKALVEEEDKRRESLKKELAGEWQKQNTSALTNSFR